VWALRRPGHTIQHAAPAGLRTTTEADPRSPRPARRAPLVCGRECGSSSLLRLPAPRLVGLVQHFVKKLKTKMLKNKWYQYFAKMLDGKMFFNIFENCWMKKMLSTF
jgi:hypothetical protein